MNPSKRIELDTRTVVGVEVTIVELVWPDGGRSFDVHRTTDCLCLTMEGSFDTIPTNDQIVRLFSTVQCRHCFTPLPAAAAHYPFVGWAGDCCPAGRAEIDEAARLE